jgi:hypothetical protein
VPSVGEKTPPFHGLPVDRARSLASAALLGAQVGDRVDEVVAVELDEGSFVHGHAGVLRKYDVRERRAERIAMWRAKRVEDAFRRAHTEPDAAALPF